MQTLRTATVALLVSLFATPYLHAQSLLLTDVPPITVSSNGQVIENVRINATNQPAILVQNFSDVTIRNVEITHEGGYGIQCVNAPGLTIQNVSITHTGTKRPLPTPNEVNINCEFSDGLTVTGARLRGGSSGIYVLASSNVYLSFIEGYDFRGPFPRGQLVQFNNSPFCTLEDFSAINNNLVSWVEDNVSIFHSDNCVVRRGFLDGNNSPSGVGVMFEGSASGLVEDVDTMRQGNGSFSAYPSYDITFRRSRARDNICENQGRGAPLSNALVWAGSPDATGLRIENSNYFNLCNPSNTVWDGKVFDMLEISSADFQPRSPIVNNFPWESGNTSNPTITPPADIIVQATGLKTIVNIGQATATDDVSTPANIIITNNAPASFPVGAITVIWTATDEGGNSATATQIVTVVDTTAPIVTPPPNLTVTSTGTLTPVDIGVATATDNVGVVIISNDVVVTTPPPSFPVGTTAVTWNAEDAAGNIGMAIQTITVQPASSTESGATNLAGNIGTATQTIAVQPTSSTGPGTETVVFEDGFTNGSYFDPLSTIASDTAGTGWIQLLNNTRDRRVIVKRRDYINPNADSGGGIIYHANYGTVNEADVDIEIVAKRLSGYSSATIWLIGRYADVDNFFAVSMTKNTTAKVRLYKIVSGVSTLLGTSATTPSDGDAIKLGMRGSAIKVYINGIEEISVTETDLSAKGKSGLGWGAVNSDFPHGISRDTTHISNIKVTEYGSGGSSSPAVATTPPPSATPPADTVLPNITPPPDATVVATGALPVVTPGTTGTGTTQATATDFGGPFLQVNSPSSMTVKWRTALANPDIDTLYYWTTKNNLSSTVSSTTQTISCGTNCELLEHEAVLTGLLPNTQYFFSIGTSISSLPILDAGNP